MSAPGPSSASAPLAWPPAATARGRPGSRRLVAAGVALLASLALAVRDGTGVEGAAPARAAARRAAPSRTPEPGPPAREARRATPAAPEPRSAAERVVPPRHAAALFAQHTWVVLAPAPPPPPPPPPPPATAPPFPYAFVGSYAPQGKPPVYFLSRGDRVIDAHVGDRLDGVYELESAAGGQLIFVYLPLDVRQAVAAGGPK